MDKLTQLFQRFDGLTVERRIILTSHFGKNFLEGYMDAGERIWYKNHIEFIDNQLIDLANKIANELKLNRQYKKIAEVYKDKELSAWYNKRKIEKNKEAFSKN